MEEAIGTAAACRSSGNPARPCTGTVIRHRGWKGRGKAFSAPGRIVRRRARARPGGAGTRRSSPTSPPARCTRSCWTAASPVLGGHHVPACCASAASPGSAAPRRLTRRRRNPTDGRRPQSSMVRDINELKDPPAGYGTCCTSSSTSYHVKSFTGRPGRPRTGPSAKEFIEHAIEGNGEIAPQAVHADRGTSMTSNTVAGLYAWLGIDQSHSRPHVSNDNPYSEANFKTLSTAPRSRRIRVHRRRQRILPRLLLVLQQRAPAFRHSDAHPASVHDGSWVAIEARRAATLDAAYRTHPERFHRRPRPRQMPARAWINEPPATPEEDRSPQTTQAA